MATDTAKAIEKRNWDYIDNLGSDITKYISFLSTISRFHRYPIEDLPSFALEAPATFTAVASSTFWSNNYRRTLKSNAKGVTLIRNGQEVQYYDVSETDKTNNSLTPSLWQYKEDKHSKYINATVPGTENTEEKIRILAENIVSKSITKNEDKEIVALSAASVALDRMGISCEETHRLLASMSMQNHDVRSVIMNTYSTARGILDAVQKSVVVEADLNVNVPANNPLIQSFGVIDRREAEQNEIQEKIEEQQGIFMGFEDEYTSEADMEQISDVSATLESAESNLSTEIMNENAEESSINAGQEDSVRDTSLNSEDSIQNPDVSDTTQTEETIESRTGHESSNPTLESASSVRFVTEDQPERNKYMAWIPDENNQPRPVRYSEYQKVLDVLKNVVAETVPQTASFYYDRGGWNNNNLNSDLYFDGFRFVFQTKRARDLFLKDAEMILSRNEPSIPSSNNSIENTETLFSKSRNDITTTVDEFIDEKISATQAKDRIEHTYAIYQNNTLQERASQSTILFNDRRIAELEIDLFESYHQRQNESVAADEKAPQSQVPDSNVNNSEKPNAQSGAEEAKTEELIENYSDENKASQNGSQETAHNEAVPNEVNSSGEDSHEFHGFIDNMTPLQQGRIRNALERREAWNNRISTRAEIIEDMLSNGALAFTHEENDKTKYAIESPVAIEPGAYVDITKIEYDYWNHLYNNSNQQVQPQHFTSFIPNKEGYVDVYVALIPRDKATARYTVASDIKNIAKKYGGTSGVWSNEGKGFFFKSQENMELFIDEANNLLDNQYTQQVQPEAVEEIKKPVESSTVEHESNITEEKAPDSAVSASDAILSEKTTSQNGLDEAKIDERIENHSDDNKTSQNESQEPTVQTNQQTDGLNGIVAGTDESAPKRTLNQIIEDDSALIRGNNAAKNRFRKNMIAIRTLQYIEDEQRPATPEEMESLREYNGFGGLSKAFDFDDPDWSREAVLLRSVMNEKEYASLRQTVLNAYYTPNGVVKGIYKGLENMGFSHGTVIDPSMGVGAFFANMPESMKNESHLYGVELDSLTGRLSKALHPDAEVSIQGFETTAYLDDSFDAAVSNIPFGDYRVYDSRRPDRNYLVHNYFIDKMIDQVRPGGLVAVITSRGTMDSKDNSVRNSIAQKADLIRAIRLPNTAFKDAGTPVTTDIIFFQKRENERSIDDIPEWLDTWSLDEELNPTENGVLSVNNYFIKHPEFVLGRLARTSSAHGPELTCLPDGRDLDEAIADAVSTLPRVYSHENEIKELPKQFVDTNDYNAMSFIIEDGVLKFYDGIKVTESKLKGDARNRVLHAMRIRDAVKEVINIQVRNGSDEELIAAQTVLSSEYDSYIETYKTHLAEDTSLKRNFSGDTSYPLLRSLEKYKTVEDELVYDGKTEIFSQRTINPDIEPTHADTAIDALAISMQQKAFVDLPYMEDLTGMTRKEIVDELEFSQIFFDFEDHMYKVADEYLSGDVREKLERTEGIADSLNREFSKGLADDYFKIPDFSSYEPKDEIETKILSENPIRSPYFSFEYMEWNETRLKDYILSHADDRDFIVQVAARQGADSYGAVTSLISDKINEDPTIILDAMLIGRQFTNSRFKIDKHLEELVEAIGETETLSDIQQHTERLYMLYSFLKEHITELSSFEYPSSWNSDQNVGFLKSKAYPAKWEEFKDAYYEHKNAVLNNPTPEMDYFIQSIDQAKRNIEALEKVKPKDLLPEEIHAGLGATWIPTHDIEDFLSEVLNLPSYVSSDLKVIYSEATGTWKIEYNRRERLGERATTTYGLENYINGIELAELALNLKQPKISKTVYINGEEKSVVDQEKTILVQEKQTILKNEFEKWIFKDEDRATRLAAYYNRYFNNIVPREYNGNLLSFPGMNTEITLKPHQRNAIAHTLFGGNTLLAHCVGAGKTFEMVASIMEAKRLGLTKKPLVAVPKHLTEQFGTEFLRLYPNANILIASEKEFSKENRQEFCSKVATQNWDAVVLGYTQLERIPISMELDQKIMEEQIEEIIDIITELKNNNGASFSIRQAEKKRKSLEAKLKKISDKAAAKQDNTITFEQLGCDRMYVDEAHYYKNLEIFSKMSNVAGISTSKSDKTDDFYKKCLYINKINNGKCGLVFATGTPVSNSMSELYTMQKYLQPERLKKQKLKSFDTWASCFGQTVTASELAPDGSGFRTKTRFSKFHNLPELMNMFSEVADIKTADQLDLDVPDVEYTVCKVEASEIQKQMVAELVERAKDVKDKKVDKCEDNMLKITTDGKKLALDQRLLNPSLPDDPNSKVNLCVKNILDVYKETADKKSTQLVFCDQSTPSDKFNVYDDVRKKLIDGGVNPSEIAFIHDAPNSNQKEELFKRVRKGEVRVLLGSTPMMGTGTNVQDKLIATHDLDVPWRPSDLEQRAGRIVRQGNENKNVKIFRYVTEGTFDGYLWQLIENKQRFISQIMSSKSLERSAEDVDETTLSYAEIKAIAAGNPLIKEKLDIDVKLNRLSIAREEHGKSQRMLAQKIDKFFPEEIQKLESKLAAYRKDAEIIKENTQFADGKEVFSIKLGDKEMHSEKEAKDYIAEIKKKDISLCGLKGKYKGLNINVVLDHVSKKETIIMTGHASKSMAACMNPGDNLNKIKLLPTMFETSIPDIEKELADTKEALRIAKEELGVPFPQEDEFTELRIRSAELEQILNKDDSEQQIGNEVEKRIQAIFEVAPENQCERYFFSLAKQFLKNNDNHWKTDFDSRVSEELLRENFPKTMVTETLFKCSPSVMDKEHITGIVDKMAQMRYVASR